MTARPDRLVAILGTGTEVGKTWVAAAALTSARRAGLSVAARKPAQSAEPDDPAPSDADVLAVATGEDPLAVCPAHRHYAVAMAPPMAAETPRRSRYWCRKAWKLRRSPPSLAASSAARNWASER